VTTFTIFVTDLLFILHNKGMGNNNACKLQKLIFVVILSLKFPLK